MPQTPLLIEPFAGSAALSLRARAGAYVRPPLAYTGSKRKLAPALLAHLQIPPSPRLLLADAGPMGAVWVALTRPALAEAAVAYLRTLSPLNPRALRVAILTRLAETAPLSDLAAALTGTPPAYTPAPHTGVKERKPRKRPTLPVFDTPTPHSHAHDSGGNLASPAASRPVPPRDRSPSNPPPAPTPPQTPPEGSTRPEDDPDDIPDDFDPASPSLPSPEAADTDTPPLALPPFPHHLPPAEAALAQAAALWLLLAEWSFRPGSPESGGAYPDPMFRRDGSPCGVQRADAARVATFTRTAAALVSGQIALCCDARALTPAAVAAILPDFDPAMTWLYLDPPYAGTVGYAAACPREDVIALAQAWQYAGARVGVSEAVPLPLPFVYDLAGYAEAQGGGVVSLGRRQPEWLSTSHPAPSAARHGRQLGLFRRGG